MIIVSIRVNNDFCHIVNLKPFNNNILKQYLKLCKANYWSCIQFLNQLKNYSLPILKSI